VSKTQDDLSFIKEFLSSDKGKDQFVFKIDKESVVNYHIELKTEFNTLVAKLSSLTAEFGLVDFNHNSVKQVSLLLESVGVLDPRGASKEVYSKHKHIPVIDLLCQVKDLESIRRDIEGNSKGENSFLSLCDKDSLPFESSPLEEPLPFEDPLPSSESSILEERMREDPLFIPPEGRKVRLLHVTKPVSFEDSLRQKIVKVVRRGAKHTRFQLSDGSSVLLPSDQYQVGDFITKECTQYDRFKNYP
jgi:hypothetical protein